MIVYGLMRRRLELTRHVDHELRVGGVEGNDCLVRDLVLEVDTAQVLLFRDDLHCLDGAGV